METSQNGPILQKHPQIQVYTPAPNLQIWTHLLYGPLGDTSGQINFLFPGMFQKLISDGFSEWQKKIKYTPKSKKEE